jgi:hypothetical protein
MVSVIKLLALGFFQSVPLRSGFNNLLFKIFLTSECIRIFMSLTFASLKMGKKALKESGPIDFTVGVFVNVAL